MNIELTENEFHKAWCNTPFYHAPEGYWEKKHEDRKRHKYVGRKAYIHGKILTCKEAESDLVIFDDNIKLSDGSMSYGEIIISGNDVENIKWKD